MGGGSARGAYAVDQKRIRPKVDGRAPIVNRRASPRVPIMILEVKGKNFDKSFIASAEDLGAGGLRLTSAPLKLGDRFPIEFVLPDRETKIACFCEVAWKMEMGFRSEGVGLRFVDLSEKAKVGIEKWIEREEKKKKDLSAGVDSRISETSKENRLIKNNKRGGEQDSTAIGK